jgi:hypothetical protein
MSKVDKNYSKHKTKNSNKYVPIEQYNNNVGESTALEMDVVLDRMDKYIEKANRGHKKHKHHHKKDDYVDIISDDTIDDVTLGPPPNMSNDVFITYNETTDANTIMISDTCVDNNVTNVPNTKQDEKVKHVETNKPVSDKPLSGDIISEKFSKFLTDSGISKDVLINSLKLKHSRVRNPDARKLKYKLQFFNFNTKEYADIGSFHTLECIQKELKKYNDISISSRQLGIYQKNPEKCKFIRVQML